MRHAIVVLALCASPAAAGGYSDHSGVQMFTDSPCGDVVAAIDWLNDANANEYTLENGLEATVKAGAKSAMAWGVLLGIDLERGGLHTPEQTTLERLRENCAESPETPAKAILDGF